MSDRDFFGGHADMIFNFNMYWRFRNFCSTNIQRDYFAVEYPAATIDFYGHLVEKNTTQIEKKEEMPTESEQLLKGTKRKAKFTSKVE